MAAQEWDLQDFVSREILHKSAFLSNFLFLILPKVYRKILILSLFSKRIERHLQKNPYGLSFYNLFKICQELFENSLSIDR